MAPFTTAAGDPIDDDLLRRAREILGGEATKKDAVNAALSLLVRLRDQRETIDWITATDPIADLRDPAFNAEWVVPRGSVP